MLLWLLFVLLVASGSSIEATTTEETETAQFFTQLYKSNLQQMVAIRNESIEPCVDFYAHACGQFEQQQSEDAVPPYLYNLQDRMEFFEAQHGSFQTLPGKLLGQLYSECKQRNVQHVLSVQPVLTHWQQLLLQLPMLQPHQEQLQAWPYLRHQWRRRHLDEQLNWIELSAQLAAHGLPTLLHIYFAAGTIYVAPMAELPCPTLQGFRDSMATLLKDRNEQVSHVLAHELRMLCRGMRGELPLGQSLGNDASSSSDALKLDDNTLDYFQRFFAQLNFTPEQLTAARKLSLDVAAITQAWLVLRQTEPRIITNYVLWQLQQKLAYHDCFQLSKEFERLLHLEYWQWHVFAPKLQRNVALAMYQLHTTRFQTRRRSQLSRRDWYGYLLPKQLEQQELQIARLLQAHAQHYLNLTELTLHYSQVQFTAGSFYSNLLRLRRAQLRHSFESPFVDEEDVQQPAYFLRHFLHFALLTLHRPIYHYYATQGLELWQLSRLLLDTDGYYTALDCLQQQSQQLYDPSSAALYRQLSSHEVSAFYGFQRAFLAALRDYHFWLAGERFLFAEQFVLQYFGLDEQRVLFYAAAQQLCNRQDEILAPRLNRAFMNTLEFQEAFKCDAQAPMNPPAKCLVNC